MRYNVESLLLCYLFHVPLTCVLIRTFHKSEEYVTTTLSQRRGLNRKRSLFPCDLVNNAYEAYVVNITEG